MFLFKIRDLLWSFPVVALLIAVGTFFSVSTRFFQFRPFTLFKETIGSLFLHGGNKKRLLASVSTALGGTVGVGSITGVAIAISVGGPGSIFWMWVSGLTGMALKYAEVYLAVKHRKRLADGSFSGGAPYALTDEGHPILGKAFALLTVFASLGVGNLTQISALTESAATLSFPPIACGAVCSLLLAFSVFGGQERIGRISLATVPFAAFLYIVLTVGILLGNLSGLPGAISSILKGAFGIRPAIGGVSGQMIASSMRVGFARGVFSNEAGVGSSPLAHAASGESNPQKQGLWGAFEVFVDTFLISSLTAAALLVTGQPTVSAMFSFSFGRAGVLLFTGMTAAFAFSSILSWCFYGDVCLTFLAAPCGKPAYRLASVLLAFFGAVAPSEWFWCAADILNALMLFLNLFLLLTERKDVSFY